MSKLPASPTRGQDLTSLKIAIVCDWLTNLGGGERVVLALHKMFPEAPIYTSVYNPDGFGMDKFAGADIRTTFIQHLPLAKTKHQLFTLARAFAFPRIDFSAYDLVISASGAEAKGIVTDRPGANTIHINYCHSPTHYYWVRPNEYLSAKTMGIWGKILRFGLRLLIKPMRRLDYRAAQRPDLMLANSNLTKSRIKQFYDREAEVVFPPVDTERFKPPVDPPRRSGFVSLGRQVHYMRRDLAVKACSRLGILLRVIGRGPENDYLRSIAGPTIEFYEDLTDAEVAEALWHAEGLISCGIEDFGITAVEALAAGCPVIALKGGGAEDIIKPGKHGEFFEEQTVASLAKTLKYFDSRNFNTSTLTKQASTFSETAFFNSLRDKIKMSVNKKNKGTKL